MTAILLVPSPAWRERLLAPGVYGGRPPIIYRCGCGQWGHAGCAYLVSPPIALVLAWAGAIANEGMDRLARVQGDMLRADWTLAEASYLAARAAELGMGEVVEIEGGTL